MKYEDIVKGLTDKHGPLPSTWAEYIEQSRKEPEMRAKLPPAELESWQNWLLAAERELNGNDHGIQFSS